MSDAFYAIEQLATTPETVFADAVGANTDYLTLTGSFPGVSDIRLSWTAVAGVSTAASGQYTGLDNVSHRLVLSGLIENVIGSAGADFIQGNEVGNVLYGIGFGAVATLGDTIWGGGGNDIIFGGSVANGAQGGNFQGDDGADEIYGSAGADTINGGADVDFIMGGRGADILAGGGSLHDKLGYATSNGAVTINITFGSTTTGHGGDAEGDQITGFTDVSGSLFADIIRDTVDGSVAFGGNDNSFSGYDGDDRLVLGGGNDVGSGDNGNDTVLGGAGKDTLAGGLGFDDLSGGLGADLLQGGALADTFRFASAADSTAAAKGRDTIADFHALDADQINLHAIDANTTRHGNQDFTFVDTAAFSGAKGELRLVVEGLNLIIKADLNGDRQADFAILVLNTTALIAGDFVL